jgi:hypothetical protein
MPGKHQHAGGIDLIEMIQNARLMGAEPLVGFLVPDVARVTCEVNFRVTVHQRRNVYNHLIRQIKLYIIGGAQ